MKLIKPGNINNILEVLQENVGSRSFNISSIEIPVINGFKYCKWCASTPIYGQKHYCSDDCKFSMYVFCYPQTYPATRILIERQRFKCACCNYSYLEFVEEAINELQEKHDDLEWDTDAELILRRAFSKAPDNRKPETDHIIAISNGGDSFGLSNVEIKCNNCHKNKTSAEARERNKKNNTYSGSRSTWKKVSKNSNGD